MSDFPETVRDGYRRLRFSPAEVWSSLSDPTKIVITGTPSDETDENHPDYHNCDAMGCGSAGAHIIMRARATP